MNIDSTTDSQEAVTAALGKVAAIEVKVDEPAAEETKPSPAETKEASETSKEIAIEKEGKEETAEQKAEKEAAEKKAKKKGGFKKRIDKLNAKASALEQEREYWRQQALSLSQKAPEKQSTDDKKATEIKADGRPKEDQFETHAEYVEALTDWKLEQKLSEREKKAKESEVKTEFERKAKTHNEKVEKFKDDHEDFDDLMEAAEVIPLTTVIQQAILDSENGPALQYALAKDLKEFERIARLPAIKQAVEIGKLEAKLAKASEPSQEKKLETSKAPRPITPVDKGSVVVDKDPSDMSYPEFKKWREAQIARR